MSKKAIVFLSAILFFALANASAFAEIRALTLDGKPVVLSDDGTWSYTEITVETINPNGSASDMSDENFPFTCKVIGEIAGGFYLDGSTWQPITQDQVFTKSAKLKSSEKFTLEVELPKGNKIKLFNESIVEIFSPIRSKPGKLAQLCSLESGEANFAISLDGRELLTCRIGDGEVLGASGLFKIIFDLKNQSGEVVVKNGLVEVITSNTPDHKNFKISGFYKSMIENGKFSSPTQASIITYSWR
ncbi:MAG: hypothetical protein KKB51_20880 [Candidatus Riflebacteria bacterium]|nr:hypothetical protein [Candidatus Riflebacteria bacterium]